MLPLGKLMAQVECARGLVVRVAPTLSLAPSFYAVNLVAVTIGNRLEGLYSERTTNHGAKALLKSVL